VSDERWTTGQPTAFMDQWQETEIVWPVVDEMDHEPMIVCGSEEMAAVVARALNALRADARGGGDE